MNTTSTAMASHSASDGLKTPVASKIAPHGMAFGKAYFEVSPETFDKARLGRSKGRRWDMFLSHDEMTDVIRGYAKQNKNPDILLKHSKNGTFMYAQKRLTKNG